MNAINKKKYHEKPQIELFATSKGVHAIKSPMRVKILSMLREGQLSFDEIVELSERAKSTVSAHLKALRTEGIIDSKYDPLDRRKKIFYINSEYLGKLYAEKEQKNDIEDYVSQYVSSEGDPFEFFRLILHTLRVSLISQGIEINPILHEAGIKVGKVLYEKVADPDINKFIENIAKFWETHYLGSVEVKSFDPLIINVYECYECKNLPYLGKPACSFDSGLLEALFSAYYHDQMDVDETKCYALGDNHCSFILRNKHQK